MSETTTFASVEITRVCSQSEAERLATTLRRAVAGSYLKPEVIVAPYMGEWCVSVGSAHPDALFHRLTLVVAECLLRHALELELEAR